MKMLCVSDAFYEQLKSLCITDFPCGQGSWKNPHLDTTVYSSRFVCNELQYDSTEELLDLEQSKPYAVDYTWSKEAESLRKLAIEQPEYLNDPTNVLKHFTTLRIVNRNVHVIDAGLLKFTNLKELFLGANCIRELNGKNIPKNLQVLELVGNEIDSLSGLKENTLRSLLHLGVAHNKLQEICPDAFSPNRWCSLLSLDLSYNNLNCLQTTVNIIKQLMNLKTLMLIGNPLYLSKCYHSYIIDSISNLAFLDNTEVSADDKHKFNSFSKIKDLNVNTSEIVVDIVSLSNIKKPSELELQETDALSEYPKIEFKYHVEFKFLNDLKEQNHQDGDTSMTDNLPHNVICQCNSTEKLAWVESLDLNFTRTFHNSKLQCLEQFLKNGVQFDIVMVKHSYVLEDPALTTDNEPCHDDPGHNNEKMVDKSASKERCKNNDKGKSASKAKPNVTKEKPGKKDKRQQVTDLFELPQERKIAGSYHVDLGSFVDNDDTIGGTCCCKEDEGIIEHQTNECTINAQSVKKGDCNDKKKHKETDKSALKVAPVKAKGLKSATNLNKGAKSGKGKEKLDEINEGTEHEIIPPPPPLTITFQIKLNRYNSTKEAVDILD